MGISSKTFKKGIMAFTILNILDECKADSGRTQEYIHEEYLKRLGSNKQVSNKEIKAIKNEIINALNKLANNGFIDKDNNENYTITYVGKECLNI